MNQYYWESLEGTRTCSPHVTARINVGHQDLPLHVQEDFSTLAFIHEGSGHKIIGTQRYQILPGSIYVIHPGIPHAYVATKGLVLSNFCFTRSLWKILDPSLQSLNGFLALFQIEPALRRARNYPGQLCLEKDHFDRMIRLVGRIMQLDGSLPAHPILLKCRVMELIAELSTAYEKANLTNSEPSAPLILSHLVIWMENNLAAQIGNDEIAACASLSVRTLHRLFKDVYKMTPIEFLQSLRLKKAHALLQNSTKSIGEIAGECGFSDGNYFARRFRITYGYQPREVRIDSRRNPTDLTIQ